MINLKTVQICLKYVYWFEKYKFLFNTEYRDKRYMYD